MFGFFDFDDWSDELAEKVGYFQDARVVPVQQVDEQAFDVRTVVVLVGHDHQAAVP